MLSAETASSYVTVVSSVATAMSAPERCGVVGYDCDVGCVVVKRSATGLSCVCVCDVVEFCVVVFVVRV